jgi:hypothetical protein
MRLHLHEIDWVSVTAASLILLGFAAAIAVLLVR